MRKVIVILIAGGLALFTSTAVAGDVEFEIFRGNEDGGATPDYFGAEIDVWSPGATAVAMSSNGGVSWDLFNNDGGGWFWLDTDDYPTLGGLVGDIAGPKLLEITHNGANSPTTYGFNVSNDEAAINDRFPAPLPQITSINLPANPATMSWNWAGDPNLVDGLGVDVCGIIAGNWVDIYDKNSGDDPPDYIPKTIHEVNDILFPQPPGNYDELEFLVGYANGAYIGPGIDGVAISGWTHLGGDELFGGPEDVDELFVSEHDIPEPASMTLLALGGLALLRRRRRKG